MTWLVVAVMFAGLIWGSFVSAPLCWFLLGAFAVLALLSVLHRRRVRRVKEGRKEESICTFSRTLPAKAHDTWVVRAAYEEMSRQVGAPIHPSDEVAKFWGIDGDDLDEIVLRIAHRAGRSTDDVQQNPILGRVVTVADMIAFIEYQPKASIRLGLDHREIPSLQ